MAARLVCGLTIVLTLFSAFSSKVLNDEVAKQEISSLGDEEVVWPADSEEPCSQGTKQKAMYGYMSFQPMPAAQPFTDMQVVIRWDDLRFNSVSNPRSYGGVYVAYTFSMKNGPGGYLGPQIKNSDGGFLFSIWDADRFQTIDGVRTPQASSSLCWPLNMQLCKRNCQDCALAYLQDTQAAGISTGTQCTLQYPDMKVGDEFEISLMRTVEQTTIHTSDFGGFPTGHVTELGETDRNVTGAVWEVWMKDLKRDVKKMVGSILFEGDGSGMNHLSTFDEMLGCNKCNRIHHKDTRYNLVLDKQTSNPRRPIKMQGSTKYDDSTCKMYKITGEENDHSISFESGPWTEDPFTEEVTAIVIWD